MISDLLDRMIRVVIMDNPTYTIEAAEIAINAMNHVQFLHYLDLAIEMQKVGQ